MFVKSLDEFSANIQLFDKPFPSSPWQKMKPLRSTQKEVKVAEAVKEGDELQRNNMASFHLQD